MNYQDNINSSVKFGSVIHYSPQAIERSYSPLIETYDETNPTVHKETWKLTTSPQRSQSIRNSATTIKELPKEPLSVTFKRSCSSLLPQTKSKRKELPPIPITSLHNDSYCELLLTQYQNMAWLPPLREVANSYYEDRSFDYQQHLQEAPHCAVPSEEYSKFDCPYTKHRTDYQSRPSLSTIDDYYVYSPTESTITEEQEDNIMARPTKEDYYCPEASETPPRPQIPSPKTQDGKYCVSY
jgi:hypothetical protein